MKRRYSSTTSFLDILFNTLIGFVFLFIMAFLLIAPIKKKADITTKAEYVITLTWDDQSKDDIDLWIQNPLGDIMFFRDMAKRFVHLDRDDLGMQNDTIRMPNGTIVSVKMNQEIATIRGFIPGEWIINIHMWKKRSLNPSNVIVKIEKLNPVVKTVIYKKYNMNTHWEEITVVRLEMAANGDMVDIEEDLFMSLISERLSTFDRSTGISEGGDS